jgi:tetratricopeptide (TPR) repeat protein
MVLTLSPAALAETLSNFIRIQAYKTHGRVSVHIDPSVEVQILKGAQEPSRGFSLLLKGIVLSDLGAPFGAEQQWAREVEAVAIRENRLSRLTLSERDDGVLVSGEWKFASGSAAPADPRMETFHYRKNDTSDYVIDFWPKPGPTVGQVRAAAERKARDERLAAARRKMQGRRDRRIANEKLRAELDDNFRFCREPWDEKREIFIPFRPLDTTFDFSKLLPTKTPDKDHDYLQPVGDAEEAQLFRLAVKLRRSGKHALVLKTLDFLESRATKAEIKLEANFLKANALIELGYNEPAMGLLKLVMTQGRSSKAALRAAKFLAYKAVQGRDSLASLEQFLWLAQYHSGSPDAWVFHFGAAESLASLKQTQRAAAEFRWVMENAPKSEHQALGAIRLGDLFLERRQYDQALANYFLAVQNFPKDVKKYPAFLLNRGESLYWLGQQDRAQEVFSEFLATHPASGDGWRATYRMAELAGRSGKVDKADELLLETVNRYPYSTGANLSRMRLMSCGRGLDRDTAVSTVENFFSRELERFDPSTELFVERLNDYRGLANVRALLAAGDEERAINLAITKLDSFSTAPSLMEESTKAAVSRLMGHLLRKIILKKLGEQPTDESRLSALSYYQDMAPKVPVSAGVVDGDYLLKLSQAAVDLGMPQWGQQLAQAYQKAISNERKLASADEDEIDQKLAVSERSFTEARALWVAGEPDSKIVPLLNQVIEESPYSYEREMLFSMLEHRAGRPASALQRALKGRMLAPASEKDQPRLLHWIARLNKDSGNTQGAAKAYAELRKASQKDSGRLTSIGVMPVPSRPSLLLAEIELLSSLGRWGEAAAIMGDSKAEEPGTLDSPLRYQYARVLRKTGKTEDLQKSQALLEGLAKEAPEQFWKKMAQEALETVKPNAKEGNP